MSAPLVGSPRWRLSIADATVIVSAGPDEIWTIPEVDAASADALLRCWSSEPPLPEELPASAMPAVEQLRTLGALEPGLSLSDLRPGLVWSGREVAVVAEAFTRLLDPVPAERADLLIVVRTTSTLADLSEAAAGWLSHGRPHLLVELTGLRTLSWGPLVVPGHTACLGCLAGRVARRWGDLAPPAAPSAAEVAGAAVAAGVVAHQLDRIRAGHLDLIDRTVSLDLDTLRSEQSTVLREVACPWCSPVLPDGRIDLPWLVP